MKKTCKEWNMIFIPLLVAVSIILISVTAVAEGNRSYLTNQLGQSYSKMVGADESVQYYKSSYANAGAVEAAAAQLGVEIVGEGSVLLKNDDGLPLKGDEKISLFSISSYEFILSGGGAGEIDQSGAHELKDVLENKGFTVNPVLWDFYADKSDTYGRVIENSQYVAIGEVPLSEYTDKVKNSFSDYNDAAIVVISRAAQEAYDCATEFEETGGHYLRLTSEEEDMLGMAHMYFDNVIVLLNTGNPFELDFLYSNNGEVNACLWTSYVGETGMQAIAELLTGDINPSGRLTDTYAYDLESAPSYANIACGEYISDRTFPNKKGYYSVYAEGVYVGYRYYETRYEDVVLGNESLKLYDYSSQVMYPFGYGLSYTRFEYSDFYIEEDADGITAGVTVTNVGEYAGREVVQFYVQSPYTEYDKSVGIEKSSIELKGFVKTDELRSGESKTVTVKISYDDLSCYDPGSGNYIYEEGDWYFSVGEDVHDALINILAQKGNPGEGGDASLAARVYNSGTETTSQTYADFSFADITQYDETFKKLSRSDWTGTWPELYSQGSWDAPDELIEEVLANQFEEEESEMPVTASGGNIKLISLLGADYNDPKWEELLDCLTVEEMIEMTSLAGFGTSAATSVSKPETVERDGPSGITSSVSGGVFGTGFPAQILLASSWDTELAERYGEMVGEEGLIYGVNGWYAPGANIHRTPFGGRNFEYCSEDPLLSGAICAAEVSGARSKGMYCYVKHFILNDIENLRYGISTFCDEQTLREIYALPFEMSVKDGGASGVMVAFCSVGPIWCGASKELMTNLLREEWGFQGVAITDTTMYTNYTYYDAALWAGTDMELNTVEGKYTLENAEQNAQYLQLLRRASHNILYVVVNSSAMNGMTENTEIIKALPQWEVVLIVADVIIGLSVVGGAAVLIVYNVKSRRESEKINKEE